MNYPPDHPTSLTMPRWLGHPEERILPLPAAAYVISEPQPEWFEVRVRATGERIYGGLGPVAITVSRAPF